MIKASTCKHIHIHKDKCTHIQKYNVLFYTTLCNSSLTKKKYASKGSMTEEEITLHKLKKKKKQDKCLTESLDILTSRLLYFVKNVRCFVCWKGFSFKHQTLRSFLGSYQTVQQFYKLEKLIPEAVKTTCSWRRPKISNPAPTQWLTKVCIPIPRDLASVAFVCMW